MKGIIIYKGKYGATAQYAKWLADELNFPVYASVDADEKKLSAYDLIIIGTSVYIGKLQISEWVKNNEPILENKKLFFFLVAGSAPDQKEKLEGYLRSGITEKLRDTCACFFLPGRLNIQKLSWTDRFMLKMGAKLTTDPNDKKQMLTDYDHVKKEHLVPLLKEIRKYAFSPVAPAHPV